MTRKDLIAILLSLGLIGGAAADRMSVLPSTDPAPYHQHVREVAATMPMKINDWVAQNVTDADAKQYLHANVMIDQQWVNSNTSQSVAFLFTQCPDVRDLVPHFPPVCYPGRGLTLVQSKQRTWNVDGLEIMGTEYVFESNDFHESRNVTVENFMLLPGGVVAPDMTQVKKVMGLRNRYYGAAQVQVVFNDSMRSAQRDEVFHQLVAAHKPLIDTILAGKVR